MSVRSWVRDRTRPITRTAGARWRRSRLAIRQLLFGPPPKTGHEYTSAVTGTTVTVVSIGTTQVELRPTPRPGKPKSISVPRSMLYAALEVGLLEHDQACQQCSGRNV